MEHSIGAWLYVSLIISSIGFVLFVYGRKQARLPQLVVGLALLVYPYFITAMTPMLIVGGALLTALFVVVRLGW
jgi:hypothetical protein